MPDESDVRVDAGKLRNLGIRVLVAAGVPEEHAGMTVDVLLRSDLRGIESHGFARFVDYYVNRAREGRVNLSPDVRVVEDALAAATIDGDHALGFVPGTIAMRLAMDKARTTGVGMVTVLNSTHYGPASPYALMAAEEDMIGISMTTGGKYVAPPGGSARTYGLNALSFAAPARAPEAPICLDMAASVVAAGKFEIARRRQKQVPPGWGIEQDGTAIADPNRLWDVLGAILPLGGDVEHGAWKGFGISLMIDVLTSVLSGGPDSAQQPPTRNANHFFAALRIDAFTSLDAYYDRMTSMKEAMRAAPRLEGAAPLTFPGEPEAAMEAECLEKGISYHPSITEGIRKVCEELGLTYDL